MKRTRSVYVQVASALCGGLWGIEDIKIPILPLQTLSNPPLIAIIDTGADLMHPDLQGCFWQNPGESGMDSLGRDRSKNGLDDDQNGFIDDVHGWDFVRQTSQITDRHGHGTHIAGLVHQVAPQSKLMILKYYDPLISAQDTIRLTAEAIKYAAKMKVQIINYSGGGSSQSRLEAAALEAAAKENILVVAAAGNDGQNSDFKPYFPANYKMNHILAVAAHNPHHQILDSSNYGAKSVDLSAPGEDLFSAAPGGGYALMTGTSQATALTTGVAALTWAAHPELREPSALIAHLRLAGQISEPQFGKTKGATRLHAARALQLRDSRTERPWAQSLQGRRLERRPSSPDSITELGSQLALKLSKPIGPLSKP